jgi:hypothetical protein
MAEVWETYKTKGHYNLEQLYRKKNKDEIGYYRLHLRLCWCSHHAKVKINTNGVKKHP